RSRSADRTRSSARSRAGSAPDGIGRGPTGCGAAPDRRPVACPGPSFRYTLAHSPDRGSRPAGSPVADTIGASVHRSRLRHEERIAGMISTGDLKKGVAIELDGELWQ